MEQSIERLRAEDLFTKFRGHTAGWLRARGEPTFKLDPVFITKLSKDFERASKAFKIWYGITLENKEHALRGWNWGKAEFGKSELAFNVQNRPAFEIPYSEISNTNLAGKNEVAVELNLGAEPPTNGVNGY